MNVAALKGNVLRSQPKYELFADMGDSEMGMRTDAKSVKRTAIAQAFPVVGHKMLFLFDYGDEWPSLSSSSKVARRTRRLAIPRCSKRSVKPHHSTAGTRKTKAMNDPISRNRGKPSLAGTPILSLGSGSRSSHLQALNPCPRLEPVRRVTITAAATAPRVQLLGQQLRRPASVRAGTTPAAAIVLGSLHRVGACPVGYHVSGAYCLSNR
jgi:hypothetical protein